MAIRTEQERKQEAICFAQKQIFELRAAVSQCDWSEDVDGNPVYEPGCYALEKRELSAHLREWEKMLSLLTEELPFSFCDL